MRKLQQILSDDEFNRFIYNLYRYRRNPRTNDYFFKRTPSELIHSIEWTNTIEKFAYWNKIYKKVYENTLKTLKNEKTK